MKEMAAGVLFLLLFAAAGMEAGERSEQRKRKLNFRFADDRLEIQEYWRTIEGWKRIFGPVGLASYQPPIGHDPGPYPGPPLRIFARGWGASLWRDPITGRPLH